MREEFQSFRSGVSANLRTPITRIVIGVMAVAVLIFGGLNTFENLDASHIMVVQSPLSGDLTWHTSGGLKWQGFGKKTLYKKRHQFYFLYDTADAGKDASLATTFNDGGKGKISGSLAWELPMAVEHLNQLHSKYGSDDAIQDQIIRTATEKAVTMTGPLVSSTESYSAKRNDMLFLTLDQISHGVYRTNVKEEKVKDEMTGQDKTVKVVNLIASTNVNDHGWSRQEPSPLDEFKLHAFNLTIKDVIYDKVVVDQIKQQQAAIMQVQTAIAESKQAEQAAITAAKNGEAKAAEAKWEQEVIKAKEVTTAEQRKAVAELDVKTAELRKRESILVGEGEAEKRRLIMAADGSLDRKLLAYVEVQKNWAEAFKGYTGAWVPSVVFGGGQNGSGGAGGATELINLLTAKTAREIGLDLTSSGAGRAVVQQAGRPTKDK